MLAKCRYQGQDKPWPRLYMPLKMIRYSSASPRGAFRRQKDKGAVSARW